MMKNTVVGSPGMITPIAPMATEAQPATNHNQRRAPRVGVVASRSEGRSGPAAPRAFGEWPLWSADEVDNVDQAIAWAEKMPGMTDGAVEIRPLGVSA